jgi:hypothetical protein
MTSLIDIGIGDIVEGITVDKYNLQGTIQDQSAWAWLIDNIRQGMISLIPAYSICNICHASVRAYQVKDGACSTCRHINYINNIDMIELEDSINNY